MKYFFLLLSLNFCMAVANGQEVKVNISKDTLTSVADSVTYDTLGILDTYLDSNSVLQNAYDIRVIGRVIMTRENGYTTTSFSNCSKSQNNNTSYIPLLKPDNNDRTLEHIQLRNLAVRNINEIVNTTAGVQLTANGISFRGSRENGTAYYLDGMRLLEDPSFEITF